jgi:predicted RNase H-like HicB family nuclease
MPMKPVFEKIPSGYVAWVDGLPGALTQGDTLHEARENPGDAVRLALETRRIVGALDAAGLWPAASTSDPRAVGSNYEDDPHRPMIRHPFVVDTGHFWGVKAGGAACPNSRTGALPHFRTAFHD